MALRLNTSEKSEISDIRRFCFAFWDLPSTPKPLSVGKETRCTGVFKGFCSLPLPATPHKPTTLNKRVATSGMADLAALVHKSTPPPRRVATEGMADLAAPVTKPTSLRRVATEGMADLAAPVKKSTWPTWPVATSGAAHPAAPVPQADQAHT